MAKWTGWWEQRGLGRRTMHNLVLNVATNGVVTGGGDDCIGPFTFDGQFRADGSNLAYQAVRRSPLGPLRGREFRRGHFWRLGQRRVLDGQVCPASIS